MKVFPRRITLALTVLVSVVMMTGCAALTSQEPTGMTLEDAPEVLDLSSVLPSGFVELDEWHPFARVLTKGNLGLGADASEPQAFWSESPFQLVYCFLRIIEDVTEQHSEARRLTDENAIRGMVTTFLDFVAAEQDLGLPEPRIVVTYPAIGVGAALAEGEIETEDGTLRFDMLSFRSEDGRVFGFVHSWYLPTELESVLRLGREVEKRITEFYR